MTINLNISIFSYNVFWKVMDGIIDKSTSSINKLNVLKNITNTINHYNPFIYCFQEASNSDEIIKLFDPKEYSHYLGYSKPEYILTIWRHDIIKIIYIIDGEFESGRPYTICVFEDKRYKIPNYFILINIHASHDPNTESIFNPIQNSINKIKLTLPIKRIIIVGDFNRDIGKELSLLIKKNYFIELSKNIYKFNGILTNNKTCCNVNGFGLVKNYDQIIDSYFPPILIHNLSHELWYKSKSSDHVAILSIVKNII
jgi:hypothetical protein